MPITVSELHNSPKIRTDRETDSSHPQHLPDPKEPFPWAGPDTSSLQLWSHEVFFWSEASSFVFKMGHASEKHKLPSV